MSEPGRIAAIHLRDTSDSPAVGCAPTLTDGEIVAGDAVGPAG